MKTFKPPFEKVTSGIIKALFLHGRDLSHLFFFDNNFVVFQNNCTFEKKFEKVRYIFLNLSYNK